jgi:hypothetical protein
LCYELFVHWPDLQMVVAEQFEYLMTLTISNINLVF